MMIRNNVKKTRLWQWFVFVIPLILAAFFFSIKVINNNFTIAESNFFSILPLIFYVLAALSAGWLAIVLINSKNKICFLIWLTWFSLLLLLTNSAIHLNENVNHLSAIIFVEAESYKGSVHCVDEYSQFIFILMTLISFYGAVSAFFIPETDKQICLNFLLRPSWYLTSYFFLSFLLLMLRFFIPGIQNLFSFLLVQIIFSLGSLMYISISVRKCQKCQDNVNEFQVTVLFQQLAPPLIATTLLLCLIVIFIIKPFQIDEDYSLAYNELGIAYLNNKMYKEAENIYRNALKIKPDYYSAYFGLAFVYEGQNKLDHAINSLEKALKLIPDSIEALNKLGFLYAKKGMILEAIREFEKVLDIDPDEINAIKNIAFAKKLLKQK